jgi:cysteine desulfurase / selenocysteine lyase
MDHFYFHDNANIHRGIYTLTQRATLAYEKAREKVRAFINAKTNNEIIFVRGTTEAINLVAQSYGRKNLQNGDEIIVSTMEHHSNIVPWQLICEQTGALLKVVKIKESGELDIEHYEQLLNNRTKIVAIMHVSNSLGTINPIKKIIAMAHAHNTPVLVDGAQALPHMRVDVRDLNCDFYAFSAHKMYGPTGIGVLYGKEVLLNSMPPYQGGGDMIKKVTFTTTKYADLPQKFEAGTQNVAGAVGLAAAIDFLNSIGIDKIAQHERNLINHLAEKIQKISGLALIGEALDKVGVTSFVLDKIHPHDIATILDTKGIAVRAGHHCTMPLMDFYRIPATTRVSFGVYNTTTEIDIFLSALDKVKIFFAR